MAEIRGGSEGETGRMVVGGPGGCRSRNSCREKKVRLDGQAVYSVWMCETEIVAGDDEDASLVPRLDPSLLRPVETGNGRERERERERERALLYTGNGLT